MILAALAIALIGGSAPAVRADQESTENIISELFEAMQFDKMLDESLEITMTHVAAQMTMHTEDLGVDLGQIVGEVSREVIADLKPGIRPLTARLWAKHFTEEELGELLAFYRSDTGRKSVEITPQLMQETMTWVQQEMAKSLPVIKERIEARVKAALEAREPDSNP